ncbi:hypothetical protein [Nonomuraea jabiensis]|uniref:hypothetical protein n=1 Tax=Nonomuraea jabiensis TaxID=882448 RepID=UPI003D74F8BB
MTASALDPLAMQRLAFIRLLHQQGIDQSRLPQPLNFSCVLAFHDSIELFLVLAGEHLGIHIPERASGGFVGRYFDNLLLSTANPQGVELVGRNGVKRLTDLRNAFKHANTWPGVQGIEQSRIDAATFFEENTPKVFGIQYADIDMADLVPLDDVRSLVKAAAVAEAAGDRFAALASLAEAVETLLGEWLQQGPDSPFGFGPDLYARVETEDIRQVLAVEGVDRVVVENLVEQISVVTEIAVETQSVLRVLITGVDYHSYLKFRWRTPQVRVSADGQQSLRFPDGYAPTAEDYGYCQRFVLNMALRVADIYSHVIPPMETGFP